MKSKIGNINLDVDSEEARREAVQRLRKAIEFAYRMAMENPNIEEKERKAWLNSLAYLTSVLNALLREMKGKTEESEEEDLVSLLEKIPKLAFKEDDIGTLSFEALFETFKLTVQILKNENISYAMKLEWAKLIPGLVNALLLYVQGSTSEAADRGELV